MGTAAGFAPDGRRDPLPPGACQRSTPMIRQHEPRRQDRPPRSELVTVAVAGIVARQRPYPLRQRMLTGELPRFRCAGRTLIALRDLVPNTAPGQGGPR